MKLFVWYTDNYSDVFNYAERVFIKKIGGKKHLEVHCYNKSEVDLIPLADIKLCYLIDVDTMHEYFRYEK